MSPVTEFMESGILELYVMGAAGPEEAQAVEAMASAHPEVLHEVERMRLALEQYARAHAVKPRATVKTLLLATIDYLERMKRGELPASPPVITGNSRISDYERWLSRQDAVLPEDAGGIHAMIIGYTPAATTAIVWIREKSDQEVHRDEHERFLIVEGTCRIMAGEETHALAAGDYFAVPLHTPHQIWVTSDIPCKAILQRLSAV